MRHAIRLRILKAALMLNTLDKARSTLRVGTGKYKNQALAALVALLQKEGLTEQAISLVMDQVAAAFHDDSSMVPLNKVMNALSTKLGRDKIRPLHKMMVQEMVGSEQETTGVEHSDIRVPWPV